ncbi:MAG: glycoside hydrolase family 43 protein [Gemmataceae bacterium]|nr:glycoside hydrolase family 43 protein [Gemmataceae bacterium]
MTAFRAWSVLLALAGCQPPRPAAPDTFFPVALADGADPWVIRHTDGLYYLTATTGDDVTVWRSPTLSGLARGERKVVWRPPADGPYSRDLWAPELHHLDGQWYVYVAADDGDNANHRMYVLENPAADPFAGEFTLKGKIADPQSDRWAIDGTVFEYAGRRYFVWSGWEGDGDVRQDLYVAPMANPFTLAGPRVCISRPTYPWETVDDPDVNEGPQALVRDGRLFLVYSASGAWTDDYCLGRLALKPGGDPLDPAAWGKHPEPVFRSAGGVFGPGHCSFVKSPDGNEDWIAYHASKRPGVSWDRSVRMQAFGWRPDGTPDFGFPARPGVPIRRPSGERR